MRYVVVVETNMLGYLDCFICDTLDELCSKLDTMVAAYKEYSEIAFCRKDDYVSVLYKTGHNCLPYNMEKIRTQYFEGGHPDTTKDSKIVIAHTSKVCSETVTTATYVFTIYEEGITPCGLDWKKMYNLRCKPKNSR